MSSAARPTIRPAPWFITALVLLVAGNMLALVWLLMPPPSVSPDTPVTPAAAPFAMAPRAPVAERTPYLGPTPTVDPATWLYTPGDFLLGAIRRVDSDPATALDARQWEQMSAILASADAPGRALVKSQEQLVRVARGVLEPAQLKAMEADRRAILDAPLDPDALIAALERKSQGAPEMKVPNALVRTWPSGVYVLAGIEVLEKSPKAALSPAQARALVPAVKAFVTDLRAQAAVYPKAAAVMKPAQLEAFARVLAEMRAGRLDSEQVKVSLEQMGAWLKSREAR